MKNIQHIGTSNFTFGRTQRASGMKKPTKPEFSTGSLTDMYPVVLDGGRTVIYISDSSKESEIRLKYAMRK